MSTVDAPAWRAPDPMRVPEMRGQVASWLARQGREFYAQMTLLGSQQVRPAGAIENSIVLLAEQEHRRVFDGELYWVSAEMTELARHAGTHLGAPELYEHDLPSVSGFVVFAEPIAAYPGRHGHDVEIVAAAWGPVDPPLVLGWPGGVEVGHTWTRGACWITFYSNTAPFHADAAAVTAGAAPPVLPDNELVWPYGNRNDAPAMVGEEQTTAGWGHTLCAAWLLMAQPLAETGTERAPRPARRRLKKANLPDSDVRVVRVRAPQRRTATRGETDTATREHDHRWWVRGHWRRYHVGPGRGRVIRRYIAPYLAGPDNKPVRGTERVRVWDR